MQISVDDVQVYTSCCPSDVNLCVGYMNDVLESIHNWAVQNYLTLNPHKTKCMILSRNTSFNDNLNLELNKVKIDVVDRVKNLGVIFNNDLTWTDHINNKIGHV